MVLPAAVVLARLATIRWWFAALMVVAVWLVPQALEVHLPHAPLLTIVAILATWNLLVSWLLKMGRVGASTIAASVWVDLIALTALLHFSGGATNPLVSMLVLPIVAALLSLSVAQSLCVVAAAVLSYTMLMSNYVPLHLHDDSMAHDLHLYGMWLTFVVSIAAITWLVLRLTSALRVRAAELAQVRERQMRDERIVAIGTLAAGAAHELGTPLSTMAVVVGELLERSRLTPALRGDLQLLDAQIAACKRIIGGLTERADVHRSVGARRCQGDEWLEDLITRWCSSRPGRSATPALSLAAGRAEVAAEPTLEQAILNVLDNAERTGTPIQVATCIDRDRYWVRIADQGSGFQFADLDAVGKWPIDTAGPGQGYGLMLARAAIERAGGTLELGNGPDGGATVDIFVPVLTSLDHG